ncbi:hypothetical protein [Rheinheimera sp. 1928-s]|uniref:hypothetical protein n=1 Tax=Rheinheimera sp. 1928-s TaxID=3033803 RepID=UPI002628B8A8|nr:hypothetical protein [Rheinheimera sp. 1928-s]MDF3126418.1 hypothetical protein [Rheinheimera sp. 1928-s]
MKNLILPLLLLMAGCSFLPKEKASTDNIPEKLRAAAIVGYEYAQMAENTYKPHATFTLPVSISNPKNEDNDRYGLAYSVFHRMDSGSLSEVILSFRGTEGLQDWIFGNIFAMQNDRGLAVYRDLRKTTPSNIPITVIGHSLGGAIALHVSLREENVNTFVFNTSSRFTRGNALNSERHSYSEYAEVNKILRVFTIDPKWTHSIYSCTFGHPVKNHAQDKLAACLTACAAQRDENAKQSVANNSKIFDGNSVFDRACME